MNKPVQWCKVEILSQCHYIQLFVSPGYSEPGEGGGGGCVIDHLRKSCSSLGRAELPQPSGAVGGHHGEVSAQTRGGGVRESGVSERSAEISENSFGD